MYFIVRMRRDKVKEILYPLNIWSGAGWRAYPNGLRGLGIADLGFQSENGAKWCVNTFAIERCQIIPETLLMHAMTLSDNNNAV